MIKEIPKFSGYFVDSDGNVYSNVKKHNQQKSDKKRLLKSWNAFGYRAIYIFRNKKCYKKFVHSLVLETFVGERPKGQQCRHLNGKRDDNRLENLKWGTRQENQADRILHGTDHRGEKHKLSKLTDDKVRQIRMLAEKSNKFVRKCDRGGSYKEIAKKFKISAGTVGSIVRGETWKHVCQN